MDLLFKRYASPFSYIDGLIDMGMLESGVLNLLECDNEDKMWELYLHSSPYTAPHQSFDEWKEEIKTNNEQAKPLNDYELKAALKESQDILDNFHVKVGD